MEEFVWAEVIKLIFPYSIITTIAFCMIGIAIMMSVENKLENDSI